jgi:hypothetical protein
MRMFDAYTPMVGVHTEQSTCASRGLMAGANIGSSGECSRSRLWACRNAQQHFRLRKQHHIQLQLVIKWDWLAAASSAATYRNMSMDAVPLKRPVCERGMNTT